MFQILFEHGGVKYVKPCKSVLQKDRYIKKLEEANVEYDVVGEAQPQLCGCVFKSDGTMYTYVRVEGDAEPGNSGAVDVDDSYGNTYEKEVVLLYVREATIAECKQRAKELGRKKLTRIKRVWQRTM